tara:strand:+ start:2114 stop:2527 length:414 start_codon:yes stop_codon:yes gene_type:complete
MYLNKVQLIGRLVDDPEAKTLQNGNQFSKFRFATNKKRKTAEDISQFYNIVVWDKFHASFANQYLKKGDLVFLEGELVFKNFQDKNGENRQSTEIHINQGVVQSLKNNQGTQAGLPPRQSSNVRDADTENHGSYSIS